MLRKVEIATLHSQQRYYLNKCRWMQSAAYEPVVVHRECVVSNYYFCNRNVAVTDDLSFILPLFYPQ